VFSPSEWRILVVLAGLFLSGAAWHLVEANAPLPPLAVSGQILAWNDPADPSASDTASDAAKPVKARDGKARASSRKPMLTGLVNPNTASVEQLRGLPGVGEAMAERIVEERANGAFKDLEDLQRVKGIGPKKAEKMRPWLRFD
jgi:competence ComEA-like helix-hairpin-helix protein